MAHTLTRDTPGGSGWLYTSGGKGRPLGAQSRPQVFELAGFKVAESAAFDHVGAIRALKLGLQLATLTPLVARQHAQ